MREKVPFLGHYVTREMVEFDPMIKTYAVQTIPLTVRDRQAFLGLVSYCRWYIRNLIASVAVHKTGLTKRDAKLVWDYCEAAFQTVRKDLVQPPVLAYPTWDGLFVLSTDASDTGVFAALEQEQERGRKVIKQAIAYASKAKALIVKGTTTPLSRSFSCS